MKVHIDFSIFTSEPSAFGNANGAVDVATVPVVGDVIWFLNPKSGVKMPTSGFPGFLQVERRSLAVNENDSLVRIGLTDLTVPTTVDARAIAEYFEKGFELFVDIYCERS
jgi:hypothetical protein